MKREVDGVVRLVVVQGEADPRVFWQGNDVTTDCKSIVLEPFGRCWLSLYQSPRRIDDQGGVAVDVFWAEYSIGFEAAMTGQGRAMADTDVVHSSGTLE